MYIIYNTIHCHRFAVFLCVPKNPAAFDGSTSLVVLVFLDASSCNSNF